MLPEILFLNVSRFVINYLIINVKHQPFRKYHAAHDKVMELVILRTQFYLQIRAAGGFGTG